MRLLTYVILVAVWGMAASTVEAEQRFVAPYGADSNSGQMAFPWSTISYAVTQLKPGDTLFVRGGTFNEGEIWIREINGMGGRKGKYLTIMAYKGEKPVFSNNQRGMIVNASYVQVQGLHFTNGKPMYTVNWDVRSSHVCFIGNTFTGRPAYAAISVTGDDHLVEGNTIELSGNSLGTQGHGIYVMEGARNVIRKNRISGMTGYGLHVYDEKKSEDPAGFHRVIQDVVIEQNTIFNSRERSGIIVGAGADGGPASVNNIIIRNNTVYKCSSYGIVIQGWSKIKNVQIDQNTLYDNSESAIELEDQVEGVQVRNNILYQTNSRPHIKVGSSVTGVWIDHNMYFSFPHTLVGATDQNALEANPNFVDTRAFNFRLSANSPAIDAGINIGRPFNGKAPDIGAFEYGQPLPPQEESHESPQEQQNSKSGFLQNYPNPFCQDTLIQYQLPADEFVKIDIYNFRGQHCQTIVESFQLQGPHKVLWDGRDKSSRKVPAGVYFCRLRTTSQTRTGKLLRVL